MKNSHFITYTIALSSVFLVIGLSLGLIFAEDNFNEVKRYSVSLVYESVEKDDKKMKKESKKIISKFGETMNEVGLTEDINTFYAECETEDECISRTRITIKTDNLEKTSKVITENPEYNSLKIEKLY